MKRQKGIIIPLTLIFGTIFLILLIGLLSFILLQLRFSKQKSAWEDRFHIAEAGINYYWYILNHTPSGQNPEIQDGKDWCCKVGGIEYASSSPQCQQNGFIVCGTCDGEPCYEHSYIDPETNQEIGKFRLKIEAKKICGRILGVYVTSVGFTNKYPDLKRKLQAKFAATSIAEYSYLLNSAVWAGSDREIFGKYHSNGGIRMDGTHNSLVTSAQSSWICTSAFGCSVWNCPSGCTPSGSDCLCDGIIGGGGPKDLWKFPVPSFDFSGITHDLNQMKNLAQTLGLYYPPSTTIDPSAKGYHLVFNGDGSFDLFVITDLQGVYACDRNGDGQCKSQGWFSGTDWYWSYEKINNEYLPSEGVYGGYNLKFNNVTTTEDCGLIFIEDDLWIDGVVKGKKTVAAANLETPGVDPTVFLNDNLDYTTLDGSDSLAVIAEKDVLLPCHTPDTMVVRGVFVAQLGNFGRRYYIDPGTYGWYCWWNPSKCCSTAIRDHLTIYGSIVSNGRVGTRWGSSSGYMERDNYFDSKLAKDPPPLLPYVSETLEIISFQEIR